MENTARNYGGSRAGNKARGQLKVIGQTEPEYGNRTREEQIRRQRNREQRRREQRRREQRRRARRRRKLLFFCVQVLFAVAVVLLFVNIGIRLKNLEQIQGQTGITNAEAVQNALGLVSSADGVQGGAYIEQVGLDEVETPVKREPEKQQEHPLFLQWDPRWGYVSYGDDSNIGLAGCGPVSLSMALYYLTGDETLTPDKIASYAMENGYYMSGTGTQWALMEDVPLLYGLQVDKPGISESYMKQELDEGHVLIAAMRQGDFTSAGHFIVIYGYDETGFRVNDPNCVARSKTAWSYERIGEQMKQLWSIEEG